jgi:putative membrane protein
VTSHVHDPAAHGAAPGVVGWFVPVVVLVVLVGAYMALATRRERALGRRWGRARTTAWVAGVALLALAVSPPLAGFAHADARGHMLQHLLLGMYAPLGLVLAAPVTLLLGASSTTGRRRVAAVLGSTLVRVLTHPVTAGVVDMGGLYVLYLTGLYAASTTSTVLHAAVGVHFVLAGTLFTWAVAGSDAAPHRPGVRVRVVALVLAAGAHAFLAKLLYARAPQLPPGSGAAAAEIEQAAQWMSYGGDLAEIALAVALFAGWYGARVRADRRRAGRVGAATA